MKTRPEDWLAAGFALLRAGGADELTIERLCASVARTKGAFYHHYADIPAFRAALLMFWEKLHTEGPMQAAESVPLADRRQALHRAVAALDQELEVAIRAWGYRDAVARAAVAVVDERRVAYLKQIWHAEGRPKALAARLADLEYAAFLGLLARHGPHNAKLKETYTLLIEALSSLRW